jgi:hypothetical protein
MMRIMPGLEIGQRHIEFIAGIDFRKILHETRHAGGCAGVVWA